MDRLHGVMGIAPISCLTRCLLLLCLCSHKAQWGHQPQPQYLHVHSSSSNSKVSTCRMVPCMLWVLAPGFAHRVLTGAPWCWHPQQRNMTPFLTSSIQDRSPPRAGILMEVAPSSDVSGENKAPRMRPQAGLVGYHFEHSATTVLGRGLKHPETASASHHHIGHGPTVSLGPA